MSRSAAGPRRPGGRTVPRDTESGDYEDRIKAAYPIHPELFDRLYTDWSTLQRFQSTRGVLRLMSTVIHALWTIGDASPLIMPGSVPLNTVGNGQRTRGNTIVFVAADRQRYEELDAAVREFLAWSHIAGQVNELNLTAQQSAAQAQTRRDQADDAVTGRIIGTYIWALVPE